MTYQFDFRNGETWQSGATNIALHLANGINRLNNPLRQDGTQLATITQVPGITGGTQTADVLVTRDYTMSDRASATCIGDDIIRVNDSTIGPGPAEGLEHTGAHEMLHLLGMSHGGNQDGFLREADVAQVPTKSSSCNTNAQLDSYLGLSADDIGLLSFHHDPASEGQLVADSGFEFGYDVWERLDTPTFDRVNIASASGQYRQKIKNNAYKLATSVRPTES